jgi:enterochelin esterase-like enzyme
LPQFRTLEQSDPALTPDGLQFLTLKSPALGQRADILLFFPREAAGLEHLPLVVLMHGVYGSHWAWAFKGDAHRTTQRLMDDGVLPPLVLAMPSDGLWGDGSGYVSHRQQDFERWIIDEVPAAACQACAACSESSPLLLAGLSMGGFAALRLAGKYPQRILAAAGHSSLTEVAQLDALIAESRADWSPTQEDSSVIAALRRAAVPLPPLRMDCGLDDPFLAANRQLHGQMQDAGIAHEYAEHDGGHDWSYWTRHLEDTLRFFGKILRRPTP